MTTVKPWSEAPHRDMPRDELMGYISDEGIRLTDDNLAKAIDDDPTHPGFGTQANHIGGVLYWVIFWYGSQDERTRFVWKASESFKAILSGDYQVHVYD